MDIYESESGFFDENHQIEKGREVYYYVKGLYYLALNRLDSAEYFFRKELRLGQNYNNQNAGARGLALLYQRAHRPDSAAKYALYSYEMNDSLYAEMTTSELTQMKAIYNFTHQQQLAQQASIKAEQNANRLKWSVVVILMLGTFAYLIIYKEKHKRKTAYEKYVQSVQMLKQAEVELAVMRQHAASFGNLIQEKVQQVRYLENMVEQYEKSNGKRLSVQENSLMQSSVYKQLEVRAVKGEGIDDVEWREIEHEVKKHLPGFWEMLSSNRSELTPHEFQVCILVRLNFKPKSISNMLQLSAASISKIRVNLLHKLFRAEGKPSEFDERIKKL